jgi:5-oxoprolinase (ATP-hydrolysing) subunit A
MMHRIDLNCDMGEGFGAYSMGDDTAVLDYVTSANIACGFHAGDPPTMHKTVKAALAKGVAVGAHPGLPDLQGFGRRAMAISGAEAYDMVVYQVGALAGFARALGGKLSHVKPHGALYNTAAKDYALAGAIAQAVYDMGPELVLYGLAGSEMIRAAEKVGLRAAGEVFADRTYQDDGSLTPRSHPDAMIDDVEAAVVQVKRMVTEGYVRSVRGNDVAVRADTLCIHGDQPGALAFVKRIRAELEAARVEVKACAHVVPVLAPTQ